MFGVVASLETAFAAKLTLSLSQMLSLTRFH